MRIRLSDKERQYLDYLKAQNPKEFRGSYQQELRHVLDIPMVKDINKDDNPFKFDEAKANAFHEKLRNEHNH